MYLTLLSKLSLTRILKFCSIPCVPILVRSLVISKSKCFLFQCHTFLRAWTVFVYEERNSYLCITDGCNPGERAKGAYRNTPNPEIHYLAPINTVKIMPPQVLLPNENLCIKNGIMWFSGYIHWKTQQLGGIKPHTASFEGTRQTGIYTATWIVNSCSCSSSRFLKVISFLN